MSVGWPGNINFSGTVSAPLFVSNQQIIAPVAAGTASTLTVNSISSLFGSVSTAYTATLSVGTILNFSAGGSIGTNLALTGTLTASSISSGLGSISTLSAYNFTIGGAGPCINLTGVNPGDMLVQSYGSNPMDRYGVGQYTTGTIATTRLFTSGYFGTKATLALSLAGTGSTAAGTFSDIVTVRGVTGVGTLSTTGAVGINTTNPATSFVVAGTGAQGALFTSSNGNPSVVIGTNLQNNLEIGYATNANAFANNAVAGDAVIRNAAAGKLIMCSGTSGTLPGIVVNASNQTGVGLIPSFPLDVAGAARINNGLFASISSAMILLNQNQAGTVTTNFSLYQGVGGDTVVNSAFGSPLQLKIGNVEYARLSSSGLFGINTTSPSYPLDVSGSARVTGTTTTAALTTSAGAYSLIAGGATANSYTAVGANADTSGQMIMFMNGSARTSDGGTLTGTIRNDAGGDMRFITNNSGVYVKAATGFVGVNTSSPAYTLDVSGNAHASALLCDNTCTIGSLLNLPSVAMTSNSTAGFTCSASGTNGGRQVYYLFDRTTTNGWAGVGPYTGSSPYGQLYSGTVTTTVSGSAVAGEWVQLQCPSAYNIVSYTVTDSNQRASAWTIAGSNDASTWTLLDSRALYSVPAAATVYTATSSNIAFTYLRYIVTVVTGYQVPDQAELSFTAALGRIGINNSSPSFQLDVTGSCRVTGTINSSVLNGTNLNIIGVGTIPGLATVVGGSGTSANQLILQGYYHPTPASIAFNTYGANFGSQIVTRIQGRDDGNGGGILAMQTNLTDRLLILNNGYVGINTTPSYTLDVAGSARVTGSLICSKQVAWTYITATNGASNGSSAGSAQYCVDELGYLALRGSMNWGSNGSTGFTLPSNARPYNLAILYVRCTNASTYDQLQELVINTNGAVTLALPPGNYGTSGTFVNQGVFLENIRLSTTAT